MHVYVQKSTATTFPRRASGVSGAELSHPVAPSIGGKCPSSDSREPIPKIRSIVSPPASQNPSTRWKPRRGAPGPLPSCVLLGSLRGREERLALLDDIRGELRRTAVADVLHRVDRICWDE